MTHESESKLDLRLVNSFSEFKSLEHEWNNLYQQSHRSTIFSSWDWMTTWWDVFQDQFERELFILCFYQDKQLVGLAPFQIDKSYPKSIIQGKTLRFIGTGDAREDSIVSQFVDLMVLPEMEAELIDAVSKYLIAHKNKWNFADFEFLQEDALILQCFKKSENGISRQKRAYGVRFYIPEVDSFDDYQSQMGNRWSKMFTKKMRIISRDGGMSIESTDSIESIKPALERLSDMHCSRWKDRTGNCIFKSSRFYDFHQKILHRLLPQKKAFIKTLKMGDQALAAYYAFEDKGQIHYYQSGFYTKYANRYSPLFLLVCNEIGSAIENNTTFDFMYDDNDQSYKKEQYAATYQNMYRLRWTPQPFRFFAHNLAKYSQTKYMNLQNRIDSKIKKLREK